MQGGKASPLMKSVDIGKTINHDGGTREMDCGHLFLPEDLATFKFTSGKMAISSRCELRE